MSELQPMTPSLFDRVVRRCLAKEPDDRWQTAADLMEGFRMSVEGSSQPGTAAPPVVQHRNRERMAWGLVAALVIGILTLYSLWFSVPPPSPDTVPISRFAMALSPNQQLQGDYRPSFALSPDGAHLVYVASSGGSGRQLYLRPLDSLEARPIAGTEDAVSPFFSPNSQWVGFFASGQLKKVSISGGAPVTICNASNLYGGATWGPDDTIIFAPISRFGLYRCSAAGGTPQVLTTLDSTKEEISHRWPHFLPGGKAVLFNVAGGPNWDQWPIVVQSLETGERRVVVDAGTHARYVPTGHLVYARTGTLMAVPFDLERLEVTGSAVPILEGVRMTLEGTVEYGFSELGSLVYIPGPTGEPQRRLVWLDRRGVEESLAAPLRNYSIPRLSPDGQRIAAHISGNSIDVWVYEIAGQTLTRVTFEGSNQFPIWTPDGKRVTFRHTGGGARNIWWKPVDGSGTEEQLTSGEHVQTPQSWSPDGQNLIYLDSDPFARDGIWVLPLEGEREAQPFLQTPFRERVAHVSPDGQWLAYLSDESGRSEIYVQPFPDPGGKRQISTEGGSSPVWTRNGRELFYRNGNKMMAVDIQLQPTFNAGKPRLLFEISASFLANPQGAFDVTPDGQRFLMVRLSEQELPATQLTVVQNWFEELKRLVPTDN
jgi:serine/threonine-protein kinase